MPMPLSRSKAVLVEMALLVAEVMDPRLTAWVCAEEPVRLFTRT